MAQYERGCAEMTELVASVVPNGDIQAWLDTAKAPDGGCKVCAVHAFDANEAPKVEKEKKRVFEMLGGADETYKVHLRRRDRCKSVERRRLPREEEHARL